MGFSQYADLLPGSGYGGSGIGAPVFVGRNRSLSLSLDVTDAPTDAVASVYVETASSQFATRWRKLGATIEQTGLGALALEVTGADAFVRARYGLVLPASSTAAGLSVSGSASLVLVPSAALTGAGVSDKVDLAQYHGGRFAALVTAAPSGQTLTLIIERSGDGLSGWTTAATFPVISAAGEYVVESADLDRFVRVRRAPSGVGSWTFGVSGTAHLIYARIRDRALVGIRQAAVPNIDDATKALATALRATADVADMLNRYDHPLRAWPSSITGHAIAFWDWHLVSGEGVDTNDPGAILYRTARDDAAVALGLISGSAGSSYVRKSAPVGIVDSAPANELGEVKRWSFASNPNPWGKSDGTGGL
jgi:hypothetical protein